MGNKIQTRDIKHSKTTAWEIDCNSLTLEEALKILNPDNYSIYRMAEKRGAYKRIVIELDNANPSEALKCLERIDNTLCLNNIKGKLEFGIDTEEHTDCDSVIGMTEDLEYIKQYLLKAQKDEKIIFGIEDYLNRRIEIEPIEDVKKAFFEIRNQLQVIKEAIKGYE